MQNQFNRIQSSFVGIDYRPSSVYLLEFGENDQGLFIQRGAVITESIQKISKAVIALKGAEVLIKDLKLPTNLSESEVEIAVYNHAEKYFHKISGGYSLDFHNFGSNDEEPGCVNVLLVACRRAQLDRHLEMLADANISPAVVDVDFFAFQRAMSLLSDQLPLKMECCTTAMLNLDHQHSVFQVMQGRQLIYTVALDQNNAVMLAGAHLTKHIAIGINSRVSQFFECYQASDHEHIDQLILCGDCVILPELAHYVQKLQQLPVIIGNPLLNLEVTAEVDAEKLKAAGPSFMRCSGLALWNHAHALH